MARQYDDADYDDLLYDDGDYHSIEIPLLEVVTTLPPPLHGIVITPPPPTPLVGKPTR